MAQRDGWKDWSSPEIANFNRSVDSLVALNYVDDFLSKDALSTEIVRSLTTFQPSKGKRIKYTLITRILIGRIILQKGFFTLLDKDSSGSILQKNVNLHRFILKTWNVRTIRNLADLIRELELMNDFEILKMRFTFWRQKLNQLEGKGIAGD